MDNIKLSLSIILPGGVMYSREESLKELKKVKKNKYGKPIKKDGEIQYTTEVVEDFNRHDSFIVKVKDDRGKEVPITVLTRSTKPARQVINMSEEAYNYMISRETPAGFFGNWNSMSQAQKLKWHCFNIAHQLGGYLDSYQVMD